MKSRRNKVAVLVAMVIVLGTTACSASSRKASTPTSTTPASTTTPSTLPSSTPTLAVTPTTIAPPGRVGSAVFLPGVNDSPPAQVTLVKVVDPATGADQFAAPVGSSRLVGVRLRIVFGGNGPVALDPAGDTLLQDSQGNVYQPIAANIMNCPAFTIGPMVGRGQPTVGCLTFDVDASAKLRKVLFTPNGQFGSVSAEWTLP